jgi:hypothetical protein
MQVSCHKLRTARTGCSSDDAGRAHQPLRKAQHQRAVTNPPDPCTDYAKADPPPYGTLYGRPAAGVAHLCLVEEAVVLCVNELRRLYHAEYSPEAGFGLDVDFDTVCFLQHPKLLMLKCLICSVIVAILSC